MRADPSYQEQIDNEQPNISQKRDVILENGVCQELLF